MDNLNLFGEETIGKTKIVNKSQQMSKKKKIIMIIGITYAALTLILGSFSAFTAYTMSPYETSSLRFIYVGMAFIFWPMFIVYYAFKLLFFSNKVYSKVSVSALS
jgi:hypothetical protein